MRYKAKIVEVLEGGHHFPKLILEVPSEEVLEDLSSVFLAGSVAIVTTPKFVGKKDATVSEPRTRDKESS